MQISFQELIDRDAEIASMVAGGEYLNMDDVSLCLHSGVLEITYWVRSFTESSSRDSVIEGIRLPQQTLSRIRASAPVIRSFIDTAESRYVAHSDYGTGSVRLCVISKDGEYQWTHPYLL